MHNSKLNLIFASFVAAIIAVGGWLIYKEMTRLPDFLTQQATVLNSNLQNSQNIINREKLEAKKLESGEGWHFLAPYADRENWPSQIQKSNNLINEATAKYNSLVIPILDKNHNRDVNKLYQLIIEIKALNKKSIEASAFIKKRAEELIDARDNKAMYYQRSITLIDESRKTTSELISIARTYAENHKNKTEDIESKIKTGTDLLAKTETMFDAIATEYKSTAPNYAAFIDTYNQLTKQTSRTATYKKDTVALLEELDRSYVKVLADQKVTYFVTVARESWCEGDFCGNGTYYKYPPISVDEETFEYFDNLTQDSIASYGGVFSSSLTLNIPRSRWSELKINYKSRMSSSENYAAYWIASTEIRGYHSYTIIENEKTETLGMQRVSDTEFWGNYDNLGMALVTKPFGYYESESLHTPEPVGMALIAPPTMENGNASGANQYGHWQQSNGQSFWVYYFRYRMFSNMLGGGYQYNSSTYNNYSNRNRSTPYYGRDKEFGTYGSQTYSTNKNGAFYRSNPNISKSILTGNTSRATPSVRGAGSSSRGKGPGAGGK
ncbi:MAG: hypothetical protein ABNH15_13585 [Alcanivorax sp.]|jgi:hypothetical protein|tara:strand:+ start:3768 stop:5423 length:1656 start_codon:yes stop_codon:yes gene_type:complete